MSTNPKHDWLAQKIYDNPRLVDINGEILAKNQEQALLYKGHFLTVPDVYFLTPDNNHYVEVKSSHDERLYDKGMSQLEKIMYWHAEKGLNYPDARLVMPTRNRGKYWIDMLDELNVYSPGDSYKNPTRKL